MNDIDKRIKLEALISEREGMMAENKGREMRGEMLAFYNEVFCYNANDMRELLEEGEK